MITEALKNKLIKVASVLPDNIMAVLYIDDGRTFDGVVVRGSRYQSLSNLPTLEKLAGHLQNELEWWTYENLSKCYIHTALNTYSQRIDVCYSRGIVEFGDEITSSVGDGERIELFEHFLDAFLEIAKANNLLPNLKEETDKQILKDMVAEHGTTKVIEMLNENQNIQVAITDSEPKRKGSVIQNMTVNLTQNNQLDLDKLYKELTIIWLPTDQDGSEVQKLCNQIKPKE